MTLQEYFDALGKPDSPRGEARDEFGPAGYEIAMVEALLERWRSLDPPPVVTAAHSRLIEHTRDYERLLRAKAPLSPSPAERRELGREVEPVWQELERVARREGIELRTAPAFYVTQGRGDRSPAVVPNDASPSANGFTWPRFWLIAALLVAMGAFFTLSALALVPHHTPLTVLVPFAGQWVGTLAVIVFIGMRTRRMVRRARLHGGNRVGEDDHDRAS